MIVYGLWREDFLLNTYVCCFPRQYVVYPLANVSAAQTTDDATKGYDESTEKDTELILI